MTQDKEKDKDEHARSNARGWSETISSLVAALEMDFDRLEELRDEMQRQWNENQEDDEQPAIEFRRWLEMQREVDDKDAAELLDLIETAEYEKGYPFKDRDAVYERVQESPLSVQVRSGWYSPGDRPEAPEEFEVLLTTGGPALRIRGELDEHSQPSRAWLEYQDWGTPWTEFHGEGAPSQDDLLTFCRCFYFGE